MRGRGREERGTLVQVPEVTEEEVERGVVSLKVVTVLGAVVSPTCKEAMS